MANEVINPDVLKDVEANAPAVDKTNDVNIDEVIDESIMPKEYDKKIKWLLRHGYTRINNLKVRNVLVEDKGDYSRITFVVNKPIPGTIQDADGNFVLGTTTNVFSSNYAISGCVKEIPDLAWLGNSISDLNREFDEDDDTPHLKPAAMALFFCGAEIDVIQTLVEKDTDYINPFTSSADPTVTNKDHQWFANNIVAIRPCKDGKRKIERFADKLMGF